MSVLIINLLTAFLALFIGALLVGVWFFKRLHPMGYNKRQLVARQALWAEAVYYGLSPWVEAVAAFESELGLYRLRYWNRNEHNYIRAFYDADPYVHSVNTCVGYLDAGMEADLLATFSLLTTLRRGGDSAHYNERINLLRRELTI